jgi:hypothetical protein
MYTYTTQKQVRAAFWDAHQGTRISRKKDRHGDYLTDTRVAFVDFVDCLARNGDISEALAERVTL